MPVTNYLTVNGEIIGESTGGVRTDYLTDALGSVTATVDQSASVVDTYRYKPYGELLAKTGTGSDPQFGWVGSAGYAQTGRKYAEQYVRARHYSSTNARWTSKDKYWRHQNELNSYLYARAKPSYLIDFSGYAPCSPGDCCTEQNINNYFNNLSFSLPDGSQKRACAGQWLKFRNAQDGSSCRYTIDHIVSRKDAQIYCSVVKNRILEISSICRGGDDKADPTYNVWAATYCCPSTSNPPRLKACAIRYCESGGMPNDNASGACIRSCLYAHEFAHGLMCNGKVSSPASPLDPREPCAYSAEAVCLSNRARYVCKKFNQWDEAVEKAVSDCKDRFQSCSEISTVAALLNLIGITWP